MNPGSGARDVEEFVADAFHETMVRGNVDALAEYFSEDLDYYSSSGEHAGRAKLENDIEMFHRAFPDLDGQIKRIMSQDGTVSILYELAGTHEGEIDWIPPTNQDMEAKGALIARVDGTITEYRMIFDNLGMLEQISVLQE
jgi:predicted ester cyclase